MPSLTKVTTIFLPIIFRQIASKIFVRTDLRCLLTIKKSPHRILNYFFTLLLIKKLLQFLCYLLQKTILLVSSSKTMIFKVVRTSKTCTIQSDHRLRKFLVTQSALVTNFEVISSLILMVLLCFPLLKLEQNSFCFTKIGKR